MKSKLAIISFVLASIYIASLIIIPIYAFSTHSIDKPSENYIETIYRLIFGSIVYAIPLIIPLCVPSIIIGIVALIKIKTNNELKGKYFAIAGIIISSIPIVIILLLYLLMLAR